MVTSDKKHLVPLRQVCFMIDVAQGFADMVIHQRYENELDDSLEVLFNVPTSSTGFSCNKIEMDCTLEDGSILSIETKVVAREEVEITYEDKWWTRQTAVISTLPASKSRLSKNYMRVALGKIPPYATVILRAFCSQELELKDMSYCVKIPMMYVPSYMGDASNLTMDLGNKQTQQYSVMNVSEIEQIARKERASGLWDIQVTIHGQGQLERIASLNHPVEVMLAPSKTSAAVCLKTSVDRTLVPHQDFVLYIRDEGISQPSVVSTITPSNQQAINMAFISDSRSQEVKVRVSADVQSRMTSVRGRKLDLAANVKYDPSDEE